MRTCDICGKMIEEDKTTFYYEEEEFCPKHSKMILKNIREFIKGEKKK